MQSETKISNGLTTNAHSVSLRALLGCTAIPQPSYEEDGIILYCADCTSRFAAPRKNRFALD